MNWSHLTYMNLTDARWVSSVMGRCSQAEAPIPTEIESPAGFTTPTFDGRGLREPFRSSGRVGPRYPVLVHRAAALAPRFLQTPISRDDTLALR
jgi:hypothetical protein